jgi:hypothetical protein
MSLNLYTSPEERARLIAGLRALAEFIESSPDVPSPRSADVFIFPAAASNQERRAEIDAIASLLGTEGHFTYGGHYTTSRWFGPVEYRAIAIPHDNDNGESE